LPMYAFLYVLGAGMLWVLVERWPRWRYVMVALVIWQIGTSLRAFPAYIAYANEAWGGPAQVHHYLSDANSDWGQQLKAVRLYLDAHHVANCWFAYFPDGVVDTHSYGIPCKRLPTTDTLWWLKLPMDVPAAIDGPVLISDSDLAGIEFGEGKLNPYEQFRHIPPTAVIQHGLFVYDGHFAIPLASALVHAQNAENFIAEKKTEQALAEAQQAVELAPDSAHAQLALGDAFTGAGRRREALASYQKALTNAETIEPKLQADLLPALYTKIANASR
jgi:tetratricopeptide (TPR) repeat protein